METSNWKTQFSFLKRRTESLMFHGVFSVKGKKRKKEVWSSLGCTTKRGYFTYSSAVRLISSLFNWKSKGATLVFCWKTSISLIPEVLACASSDSVLFIDLNLQASFWNFGPRTLDRKSNRYHGEASFCFACCLISLLSAVCFHVLYVCEEISNRFVCSSIGASRICMWTVYLTDSLRASWLLVFFFHMKTPRLLS